MSNSIADPVTHPDARASEPAAAPFRRETLPALVGAYLLLSCVFLWQAWRRETPTIFTDEIELTMLSRSIAETGEPARRGVEHGFTSLVPWLTAPFWWIDQVSTAYNAIKYFQTLVMAAAIFPAYALARYAVPRTWAVAAAVGAIATPALSYAPFLVEEPFAYPAATLALWLVARALHRTTWRSVGVAAAACVLAVLVRSQLTALPAILGLGLLVVGWGGEAMRRWRSTWTGGDWAGAIALALGAFFAITAAIASGSAEWAEVTLNFRGRILEYGSWAAGGFAIGVGVLPAIALLAIPFLRDRERRDPRMVAFATTAACAIVTIGWYAAVKGAYVSTRLSGEVVERNLIYLVPLATAALGAVLQRAAASWWALIAGTVTVLAFVWSVPLDRGLDRFPYYEAHGLAVLALFNRELSWPVGRIDTMLVLLVLAGGTALVVRSVGRSAGRPMLALAIPALAACTLWSGTAQVYAEVGEHRFSSLIASNLAQPLTWVDDVAGDEDVTVFVQQSRDATGIWSTEFWNRSITRVWSVEGSAPGPGGSVTPDLAEIDGRLTPGLETPLVLAVNGVELQGEELARRDEGQLNVLVRPTGGFKLRANQVGIDGDGWFTATDEDGVGRAAYNRFDIGADDAKSEVVVSLSRATFCPPSLASPPGLMRVRVGSIVVGGDRQPAIGQVHSSDEAFVSACTSRVVVLPVPNVPWRLEIEGDTFVPREIDPEYSSDNRRLAARVEIEVRARP